MTRGARSVGDRIAEARARAFVGREAELELLVQALEAPAPPFSALFVHGPGGIGKSTLLDRFAAEARARGVPATLLEPRSVGPTPEAVLSALGASTLDGLAARLGPRHLLVLDTYEELVALDAWVRDALLPALPDGALLVIAGREPPSPAWRADPGVAALLRVRALRNLRADESAALLAARGVPESLRPAAHELTHGHPLALALVSELQGASALPALGPDVVRPLLDRIVRDLPRPEQREALEIAAMARVTHEDLLTELGVADAPRVFAWMRGLSFVHETAEGIEPHDLVRDALLADLRQRTPARADALRRTLAERNRRAFERSTGTARERAFFDGLFGARSSPAMRPFYDWQLGPAGASRALGRSEVDALLTEVEAHEGPASVLAARRWLAEQPEAFIALLDRTGGYLGALCYLHLPSLAADDPDPAIARAHEVVRGAPPRAGEHVAVLRHWIWRGRYQALGSPAHAPHSMVLCLDWALSSTLAWVVLVVQRVEAWRPFFAQIAFEEHPDASFEVDGRRFHLFARDLRAHPFVGPEAPPRPSARRPPAERRSPGSPPPPRAPAHASCSPKRTSEQRCARPSVWRRGPTSCARALSCGAVSSTTGRRTRRRHRRCSASCSRSPPRLSRTLATIVRGAASRPRSCAQRRPRRPPRRSSG